MAHSEVRCEVLTGVRTGQPLSRERVLIQGADVVVDVEDKICGSAIASSVPAPRGLSSGMVVRSKFGNRKISGLTTAGRIRWWPSLGRRGAEADNARASEVRLSHSGVETNVLISNRILRARVLLRHLCRKLQC